MDADIRFEALYAAHAASVKAYAVRRSDAATADDVVADVFLIAWRRIDDVPEAARPWLYGVARRVLANHRRRAGRAASLTARIAGANFEPSPADEPGEHDPRVWEALTSLTAGDRELLTLSAWEELAPTEIAAVLDLRANTVRVRLHRARQRFAHALQQLDAVSTDEMEVRR